MTKPRKPNKKFRIAPMRFAPGVVGRVDALSNAHSRRGGTYEWLEIIQSFTLITFDRKGMLYWLLKNHDITDSRGNALTIGTGKLQFVGSPYKILLVHEAAILAPYQRRGLYPAVIRALRRDYGRPIESSPTRSLHSEKAWAKVGVKHGSRYRLNPGRHK